MTQPTVRSRLQDSGISPERIELHHAAGRIRLDGQPVHDLDQPAPPPARIVLAGE
jgi:hypothetical protein